MPIRKRALVMFLRMLTAMAVLAALKVPGMVATYELKVINSTLSHSIGR